MSRTITSFSLFLAAIFISTASAQTLTLDGYLREVEGKNQNVTAARDSARGAELRIAEGALQYSPVLFAEASWTDDKFRNALIPQAYSSLTNNTYTFGIRQRTAYGLSAAVSYDLNRLGYLGSTIAGPVPLDREFWEATPKIELNLSLWRNLFGGETQAQKQLTEAEAAAAQYNQSFLAKKTRAQAEGAFIRVASAQELIGVYEDSVKSAQDLVGRMNRQVGLRLGDNTDLFQVQANLELQRLNLQATRDELRVASVDFNRFRNIDSEEVKEKLVMPVIANLAVPARAGVSDDVRAAQETARLAAARSKLGYERNRPKLEAWGSFAPNAREAGFGDSVSRSFALGQQTTQFGLRFEMPLGLGLSSDARKGFELEREAAERLVSQKSFDEEVQYKDLVKQFEEAKKRYEIANTLAKIQRKKTNAENQRLRAGRTTTFQTVLYSQDFNNAEASRVQALARLINLYSRLKYSHLQPLGGAQP